MPKQIIMRGGFWLFLILVGCGMPYQGSMYTDSTLLRTYEPQIKRGKTTEQEIRQWFGEPWITTQDPQGAPQLVYLFEGGQRRLNIRFQDGVVSYYDVIWHGGDGTDRGEIEIRRNR